MGALGTVCFRIEQHGDGGTRVPLGYGIRGARLHFSALSNAGRVGLPIPQGAAAAAFSVRRQMSEGSIAHGLLAPGFHRGSFVANSVATKDGLSKQWGLK